MSTPKFYLTSYDRMGQRRLTAMQKTDDLFTIHEFDELGATIVSMGEGNIKAYYTLHKDLHCGTLIVAPQPPELASSFVNNFVALLEGSTQPN